MKTRFLVSMKRWVPFIKFLRNYNFPRINKLIPNTKVVVPEEQIVVPRLSKNIFISTGRYSIKEYRYYYCRKRIAGDLCEGWKEILLSDDTKLKVVLNDKNQIVSEDTSAIMDIYNWERSVKFPEWVGFRRLTFENKSKGI